MAAFADIRTRVNTTLAGPDFTGLAGMRSWAITWISMPAYTDFNNIYAYIMAYSTPAPGGGGGSGGDSGGSGGGDGGDAGGE
jgi:hypothetical protein